MYKNILRNTVTTCICSLTMEIPLHVLGYVGTHADYDTMIRLGCTCRDLRPLVRNSKVSRFLKQKVMLREYQIIRDFVEIEYAIEPDEWIDQWNDNATDCDIDKHFVSRACLATLDALYGTYTINHQHKSVDPDLYNAVCYELKLDCPDFVLLYSFWRKVERQGFI